jgi:hypothetical protein
LKRPLAAVGLLHLESTLTQTFRHKRSERRLIVYEKEMSLLCSHLSRGAKLLTISRALVNR